MERPFRTDRRVGVFRDERIAMISIQRFVEGHFKNTVPVIKDPSPVGKLRRFSTQKKKKRQKKKGGAGGGESQELRLSERPHTCMKAPPPDYN
jgi:hypothetical protein